MNFKRGNIGLFFRGDPTLRDYFVFDNRATNYGSSSIHGVVTNVIFKNGELINGLGSADFHDTGYINLGIDYDLPTHGTVMLWAKIRNYSDQGFWQDGGGGAMDISANNFRALIYDGAWKVISKAANTVLSLNKLHLLCMTWDGSYLKLYIDGKYIDQVACGAGSQSGVDLNTAIGSLYNNSNPLDGYESEFAIFSRALDKQEIPQYYKWATSLIPKLTATYAVGAEAVITGTAIPTVTEASVIAGGKTIIITLTGDTWVATVGEDNAITDALIAGIDSAQSEGTGWDAVVKAHMTYTDIVRTSDTVVTITLKSESTYNITATETITVTIPASALTGAEQIVATPTFTVTVLKQYLMAYNGADGSDPLTYKIGLANSDNEYDFTKSPSNPILSPESAWEIGGIKDPYLLKVGDTYYLYYTGINSGATVYQIGLATSTDGINFTKNGDNPILSFAGAAHRFPVVVYDIDDEDPTRRWKMWYADDNYDIGYAYSSDGLAWTKYAGNPVLSRGAGGQWDDNLLIPGCIYKSGSTWYLYYSGNDGTNWFVGLATFTNPESTYTKSGNNPLISPRTSATAALTADLTIGNKILTVADTSLFEVNEDVWLYDNDSGGALNKIASIDSSTQITLVNNVSVDFTTAQSAFIRSIYYKSLNIRAILEKDGSYILYGSAFQALTDKGLLREQSVVFNSDSLDSGWSINFSEGAILPLGTGADWDLVSAENPSVIVTYAVPAVPVKIEKSLGYKVITDTKIEKGLIYKALPVIAVQKTLKYSVITTPSAKTKSLKYDIFLGATKIEKSLKYTVYTIPTAIEKDLEYHIFLGLTKIQKGLIYKVKTSAKIEKGLIYKVLPAVAIQKTLEYAIITTPSALTKSLEYIVNPAPPQEILSGKVVVVSDSTTATSPEDIDGLNFDITLKNEGYIMAFMTLTSDTGSDNHKNAYFLININGVDSPVIKRYHYANQNGNIEVVFRSGLLPAGQYTVKGRHYTETGVTLTSKNITLIALPTEDEGGNAIKSAYDTVASDSVTGSTPEDIDGLTQDITTEVISFIFGMIVGSVSTSIKDKIYRLILSINGFEMEVDRFLDSVDDIASIGLVCRTQLPETAGVITIKGRHASEAGVTGTIEPAILVGLALSTKSSGTGYVIPSGHICIEGAELSTISTILEDMPTVETEVILTQEAHVFAVMTLEMESAKSDMENYFAININGVDFEECGRTSNVKLDKAVITIVARTTSKLAAGTYTIKGRWRTTATNTLRAINDLSLVAIGLETTTQDLPTHILRSLDYKVSDSNKISKGLIYQISPAKLITKSLRYAVAPAVAIQKSLKYIVLIPVKATKSLKYCIITTPTKTEKSLRYVVEITPAAITKSLRYDIFLGATALQKSLKYTIREAVKIENGLIYKVLQIIAINKSLKYTILSTPAAKQRDLEYQVLTIPSAIEKALKYYVITTPTEITKSLIYNILTEIKIMKDLHYEVFLEQAITKDLKYEVVSSIKIEKSLRYTIISYPYVPIDSPYVSMDSPYVPFPK